MNLIIILAVLFLSLLVIVPLIEKSNMRVSDETQAKFTRWLLPLMIVMIIAGTLSLIF